MLSTLLFSQNETVETPIIAIKIAIGETIQLEKHSIKFVEVLEDSRCPKYVNCIWAGRARVIVEISEEGKNTFQKELLFGQKKPEEIVDNNLITSEKSIVKGKTLTPYPNSEEKTKRSSYTLLIVKDKIK